MNNYYDMTRDATANQEAYNFWRDRVRERVRDPEKAELLAPTERPHLFGGKRLSLEQDFYDHFNKVILINRSFTILFPPLMLLQAIFPPFTLIR